MVTTFTLTCMKSVGNLRSFFQLFVIVLVFSHLYDSNAAPATRSISISQESDQNLMVPDNFDQVEGETESKPIEKTADFERNDYPGFGANNRHTPRLPGGRTINDSTVD